MGAYLSEPKTEKLSEEDGNEFIKYGASSMQGWRTSQEDAHVVLLDYDEKTSLFAVFDGHGGGEVAQYCARHLPQFLKNLKKYKEGDLEKALEEAFIEFDSLLTIPEVIEELKVIAGDDYIKSDEDEEDANEASLLKEEAKLPLEALIARYSGQENDPNEVVKRDHIPPHVRQEINAKKIKPVSPFLRGKQGPSTSTAHEDGKATSNLCSSSSTSNESEALNRFEPCSSSSSNSGSSSSSLKTPNENLNESDPETNSSFHQQPDEGDSVSSSVNEVNEDKNDICKVSSTKSDTSKCFSNLASESNEVGSGNSSIRDSEANKHANGELNTQHEKDSCVSTSSEAAPAKSKPEQLSSSSCPTPSSAACDNTVSAAASTSADEPSSSSKGKGKKKKIVNQDNVKSDGRFSSGKAYYDAILNALKERLSKNDEDDDEESDSSDMEYGEGEDIDHEDDDDDEEDDDDDDDDDDEDESDQIGDAFEASSTDFEIPGRDSGCTAVLAVLRGNQLFVANAGDSRCVLSRRGKAIDMSLDHKPEDSIEKKRIEAAGGSINSDGRINGGLNLSRAIGDHGYKTNKEFSLKEQMITAFPDIRMALIKPNRDEFMVLACDGIWNSMTSQEVVDFVRERLDSKKNLCSICEELFDHCLSPDTDGDGTGCDNMTCIIVKFTDVKPTDSQQELEDPEDDENKPNEEHVDPSQSDSKKQSAPSESQEDSSEPSVKRQKTDL